MRLLSLRLFVSLIVGVTIVSLCSSGYEALVGKRTLRRDLQHRAAVLAESLAGNVDRDLEKHAIYTLKRTVERFGNRENLIGVAVYDPQGQLIAESKQLEPLMARTPAEVWQSLKTNTEVNSFDRLGKTQVHISV